MLSILSEIFHSNKKSLLLSSHNKLASTPSKHAVIDNCTQRGGSQTKITQFSMTGISIRCYAAVDYLADVTAFAGSVDAL